MNILACPECKGELRLDVRNGGGWGRDIGCVTLFEMSAQLPDH